MASSINIYLPVRGQATTQSVRDNFAVAKAEIEGLQAQTASLQSTADNLSRDDVSSAGADIASAPAIDLDAASGDLIDITGTAGIAAIALSEGRERTTRFTGSLTLTHGASLVLPGAADITTEAGDFAVWRGYAGGAVRCIDYQRAAQLPLYGDRAVALTASATLSASLALPSSELTIAGGVIAPVRASHTIDTEADAATDDLDLIDASLMADGALLLLAAENGGRTVTVKHNSGTPTGNQLRIFLSDDADFPLDDAEKWLVLIRRGTAWQELTRSVAPGNAGGGLFKGENGAVGDALTGAGDIFRVNEQTLNTNTTIEANENASCTGPLAVANGVTVTVAAGGTLAIL